MMLVPESRTRVAMLKRGEVDLISLKPQDVEPLKEDGYQIIGPRDTGYPMLVFYKIYDPAFLTHKIEFHKALILGVNWDAVVKAFYPSEVGERRKGGAPLFSRPDPDHPPNLFRLKMLKRQMFGRDR